MVPSTSPAPGDVTVLCVDDQQSNLQIRRIFLETFGYIVVAVTSGKDAIQALPTRRFDVVVLDYLMPEMDGEATALAIRQRDPSLPIVLLSGCITEFPERLTRIIDAFVLKGGQPSELLQVLERTVGRKPVKRVNVNDEAMSRTQEQLVKGKKVAAENVRYLEKQRARHRRR